MKPLKYTSDVTVPAMAEALKAQLSDRYKIAQERNKVMKWDFVSVRAHGMAGVWVRLYEKKKEVRVIRTIPSFWGRLMLGGVLFFLIFKGKMKQVEADVVAVLKKDFDFES
jgi:hypothetical protein